jgi:ParB family transcriptional regulator, chromosome partitioning protein
MSDMRRSLTAFRAKRRTAMVPLDSLRRSGDNARVDTGDITELTASIKSVGVLVPIIISGAEAPYGVICGARRVAAARRCKLQSIPAVHIPLDAEGAQIASLIENVQRTDLSPIEEALAFERLASDMTQHEIGALIGKSQPYVANTLRLLKLPQVVRDSMAQGKLSRAAGIAVLSLPENEREGMAQRAIVERIPTRALERITRPRRIPNVCAAVGTLYELRVQVLEEPRLLALVDRALHELGEQTDEREESAS